MTPKQEKFAQLYVELGSAAEAYRQSDEASRMKPESIHRRAHDLLEHVKIKARIETIREAARERNLVTVDSLLVELEQARQIALGAETPQTFTEGTNRREFPDYKKFVGVTMEIIRATA
jgi:phage terminase small subunit